MRKKKERKNAFLELKMKMDMKFVGADRKECKEPFFQHTFMSITILVPWNLFQSINKGLFHGIFFPLFILHE